MVTGANSGKKPGSHIMSNVEHTSNSDKPKLSRSSGGQASVESRITPHMSIQNSIAVVIFLILIGVTIGAVIAVRSHFNDESQETFGDLVEGAYAALQKDVTENLTELTAIQGLFNSTDGVSRKQFDTFVSLFFNAEHGTQALEWIPRVTREEREEFIRTVREEGFDQFTIHPSTALAESFPVNYVFPFEPNLAAFGFDLASNDSRLAALQQARDSGALLATAPITLVQETEQQAGFLVFAPIYSTGGVPATLRQRRETLSGFGLAVFRVDDFIDDAIPAFSRSDFNLEVVDSAEGEPATSIYSDNTSYPSLLNGDGISIDKTLNVAGRTWELQFSAPTGFGISALSRLMWVIVLVIGGTLSALTLGFSYLLLNGRNRAVAFAENMNRSLIESESQRDQMFELSQDLIITAGREGKFGFVSGAAKSILGREPTTMMGAPILDFIHPDDRDQVAQAVESIFNGGTVNSFEVRFLRGDGGVVWMEWNALQLPEPSDLIFAVGRDITERRRAEEEIRNLAKFPSEDPNPVVRISADGIILYANGAATKILESRGLKAGQPTLEYWQSLVKDALASGLSKEVEIDYGPRVISYSVVPVAESGYANVYGRDITAAKEVDRLRDEFISVASHELRTPVTSIKGFLELIEDEQTGPLTQDQRRFLEAANRNADRLENLVNGLLDISRLDTGMVELERSEFRVLEAIQQVVSEMESEIEAKSVDVRIGDGSGNAIADADRGRVVQILANLLSNAIKYSPLGSPIYINATTDVDLDSVVRVSIRDEGPGIAAGEKDKVFEKFYRADNSTTRATAGTGLGLAITKALVELHGGKIWVESEQGDGSTFIFTLPKGLSVTEAAGNGGRS